VRLGVTVFLTDRTITPADLAREAEARGFVSLYVPEHTHIPVSRATPAPTGDGELADEYRRTLDPFVALSAAAAVTERLAVGTGISLVAQHDPIVMAKQIATLDHLSGGRFTLGVGFGWNREEAADHGVTHWAARRAVVAEKVALMQSLWRDEVASFAGEHVSLSPSWAWPKPVQRPRVRTLVGGGGGPRLFEAAASYGDGWMPIGGAGVAKQLPALRAAFEAAGRDPDTIEIVPFGTVPDAGKLEHYASLGVEEVVLRLPSAPRDDVLRVLDRHAAFLG
jgi:probable F420-dependent oxidoreductase